jgi:hypothetical protein
MERLASALFIVTFLCLVFLGTDWGYCRHGSIVCCSSYSKRISEGPSTRLWSKEKRKKKNTVLIDQHQACVSNVPAVAQGALPVRNAKWKFHCLRFHVYPWLEHNRDSDHSTVSVSPAPPEPAGHVEQAISVYVEHPITGSQQPEPSGNWSSTFFEIRQRARLEPLASGTLQRLPLGVLRPALVAHPYHSQPHHRENQSICFPAPYCFAHTHVLRLWHLLFASPNGFLGPVASVSYYPTGDLKGDRSVALHHGLGLYRRADSPSHRQRKCQDRQGAF